MSTPTNYLNRMTQRRSQITIFPDLSHFFRQKNHFNHQIIFQQHSRMTTKYTNNKNHQQPCEFAHWVWVCLYSAWARTLMWVTAQIITIRPLAHVATKPFHHNLRRVVDVSVHNPAMKTQILHTFLLGRGTYRVVFRVATETPMIILRIRYRQGRVQQPLFIAVVTESSPDGTMTNLLCFDYYFSRRTVEPSKLNWNIRDIFS